MMSSDSIDPAVGLLLLLVVGFIAGCGEPSRVPVANIPTPRSIGMRSGDAIIVNLQSIPDPNSISVQVDDQGSITLPFIGTVGASGNTESVLARKIEKMYVDQKIYPSIDVSVTIAQRFIHVGGEVVRPGRVLWSPNLTLTTAIQEAGGFSVFGKKTAVILTRDERTYVVDAKLALRNPARDFKVFPGDSLNVPRRL